MHVARDRPQVRFVFHQLCAITPLKDMAIKAMAPRRHVGVGRQKTLHSAGKIGLGCLQDDVQMIGHDHEGEDSPRTPGRRPSQVIDKTVAISVIANDILPPVAAGHQVIDRTGILNAQRLAMREIQPDRTPTARKKLETRSDPAAPSSATPPEVRTLRIKKPAPRPHATLEIVVVLNRVAG